MATTAEGRGSIHGAGHVPALLLALGAIVLGVMGYQFGFLGFVYTLMMPDAFYRVDGLILAAVMGIAAFFSPCAFPLLPGYMTYQLHVQGSQMRFARSLVLGMTAALGLLMVNGLVGLVIAALGSAAPFNPDPREDPWFILAPRALGGAFVAYVGALYLLKGTLSLGPLERIGALVGPSQPPEHSYRGSFLYGALYNLIGIGCTGALLLALVLYALTLGGAFAAVAAFAVFSTTMGALMVLATALVGLSATTLLRNVRGSIPAIRQVSGAIMLVVGGLTVAFVLQGNDWFTRLFFPFFFS